MVATRGEWHRHWLLLWFLIVLDLFAEVSRVPVLECVLRQLSIFQIDNNFHCVSPIAESLLCHFDAVSLHDLGVHRVSGVHLNRLLDGWTHALGKVDFLLDWLLSNDRCGRPIDADVALLLLRLEEGSLLDLFARVHVFVEAVVNQHFPGLFITTQLLNELVRAD